MRLTELQQLSNLSLNSPPPVQPQAQAPPPAAAQQPAPPAQQPPQLITQLGIKKRIHYNIKLFPFFVAIFNEFVQLLMIMLLLFCPIT